MSDNKLIDTYVNEKTNEELCMLSRKGDMQAKEALCIKHEELVEKCAFRYGMGYSNVCQLTIEDFKQSGMLGVLKAIEKYDSSKGAGFTTYAMFWIKKGIIEEIYNATLVKLPPNVMDVIVKVGKAYDKYKGQGLDFNAILKEIAGELDVDILLVEHYLKLRSVYLLVTSTNIMVGEDEDTEIQDLIADTKGKSVEEAASEDIMRDVVLEMLSILPEKEQRVIKLRYGFTDGEFHSLENIGKELGMTRAGIKKIEARAIEKLRKSPYFKILKDSM